jgi:hypothetical protein
MNKVLNRLKQGVDGSANAIFMLTIERVRQSKFGYSLI